MFCLSLFFAGAGLKPGFAPGLTPYAMLHSSRFARRWISPVIEFGSAAALLSLDGLFFGRLSWVRRKRPSAYAGRGPSEARVPHGNAAICANSGCSGREPSGGGLS